MSTEPSGDFPEIKVVTKAEAVNLLQIWVGKGHSPLSTVRVFDAAEGGFIAGFMDYQYMDTVLVVPEHMNRVYKNQQGAFTAIGAMFDALNEAEAADAN